jgi:uncharacterized protein (DUF608 family)
MDRRDFVKAAGGTTAAVGLLGPLPVLANQPPTRIIPADKGYTRQRLDALRQRGERRVYTGAGRYTLGMPVGGICAGQLYVLGDGTLGGWRIDGRLNATGYGAHNYKTYQPPRELTQGFCMEYRDASGKRVRTVLADGGGFERIEFIGEYPIAHVRYRKGPGDVDVDLRASSLFIPLNAKDSAIPCTVLRYSLTNRNDRRITGTLTAYLENGVERDALGLAGCPWFRNEVRRADGLTSVVMSAIEAPRAGDEVRPERVIADFNGPDYGDWTAEGEAFRDKPSRGTEPRQQRVSGFEGGGLVNSYPGDDDATGTLTGPTFTIDRNYIAFLIGGGGHKGQTCINLVIDGAVVRTETGRNNERLEPRLWDVADFQGKQAHIQIVDARTGPWGHVNVDHISLTDEIPEAFRRPKDTDLTYGTMGLSFLGAAPAGSSWGDATSDPRELEPPEHMDNVAYENGEPPIGAIAAPFDIAPGETAELVFVVSWHFPNLHTGHGQMYCNWFDDAFDVARYVAEHDERLWEQTRLFHKTYYQDTTFPWWLATRLMMPMANLATGTAQWWNNGRFWGWEGVGCCSGTCTHVWNYAHGHARFFPELVRSARVMQDLGSAFEEETGRVAFRGEVDRGSPYAADGQCGTVLKCYREHLTSPDDVFLKDNWPRIRKVLEYSIAKDAEQTTTGQPDGIIETRQHNTFDISFVGPNTFVGSLYLAALLAGEQMALRVSEPKLAQRYREIYERGRAWTERTLFNGDYFVQHVPPDASDVWQYGQGCLSDQLFGQNWARQLGLDSVYDEALIRKAMASVYRYNWTPAVGPYNARHAPERVFARDREGGMFVCTWPRGSRPDQPVRYKDEVWTGNEYQVAAGLAWEGLADEALTVVKAIDDRYDGEIHNPWNEVECGDHYARALASWGVYHALMGLTYDGPNGRIGMAPRLSPDDFAGFFLAAEGWGLLRQVRDDRSQTNTIEVRFGSVRVGEFVATLPEGAGAPRVSVTARGGPQPVTLLRDGGRVVASLAKAVTLGPGTSAEFRWEW